ncbi:uncharacterized protein LOC111712997 [Eurytemora carolleeae]|uniref:uncharacterized protein LOC111712997 n=1 Tax=Eurytemora carolleeae TaxID=1294199 RepID=UPI000C770CE1|nr:uncharacterized protein LOC111712997 [Eurytemora carolleeae]|eukprot:XP_023343540.1 uncharacterized protein LOC111712997 [Eurytemora affinis]
MFLKKYNSKLQGISSTELKHRLRKNVVSFRFNLLIWLLEAITMIAVIISRGLIVRLSSEQNQRRLVELVYQFITSVVSPALYFIGIEEFRSSIRNVCQRGN